MRQEVVRGTHPTKEKTMAEVYPSDSELLNLQSDSETGVEYIPTGTAPYYLHFRKTAAPSAAGHASGNDLRVYDEGGLDIGVKAGKFWLGTDLVSYRRLHRQHAGRQQGRHLRVSRRPGDSRHQRVRGVSRAWRRRLTFAWLS